MLLPHAGHPEGGAWDPPGVDGRVAASSVGVPEAPGDARPGIPCDHSHSEECVLSLTDLDNLLYYFYPRDQTPVIVQTVIVPSADRTGRMGWKYNT